MTNKKAEEKKPQNLRDSENTLSIEDKFEKLKIKTNINASLDFTNNSTSENNRFYEKFIVKNNKEISFENLQETAQYKIKQNQNKIENISCSENKKAIETFGEENISTKSQNPIENISCSENKKAIETFGEENPSNKSQNFSDSKNLNLLKNMRQLQSDNFASENNTKCFQPDNEKKYSRIVNKNWIPEFTIPQDIFPFDLDTFQVQAAYLISLNKSVFVTAHTGTGKTAIVEYAIYQTQKNNARMIYTSPLKALSNQKFYEFRKYGAGIITGDVSINPESQILIMTTEILQNMLYTQSSHLNNLQFVVFDEVHYVDNPNRGVVWEECLIMLPSHVTIVMLSASIPNASIFAEWVGKIRNQEVFIVSTPMRAVPLEYFVLENYEVVPLNHKYDGKYKQESINISSASLGKNNTSLSQNTPLSRKHNNISLYDAAVKDNLVKPSVTKTLENHNLKKIENLGSCKNNLKNIKTPQNFQVESGEDTFHEDVFSIPRTAINTKGKPSNDYFQGNTKISGHQTFYIEKDKVRISGPKSHDYSSKTRENNTKNNIESNTKAHQNLPNIKPGTQQPFLIKRALHSILKYVVTKKQTPTIFFCFSKKKCLEFAKAHCRPLLDDMEKQKVIEILKSTIYAHLNQSEINMLQVKETLSLLECGVGIHHSGLLPILKEIVEILFSHKLLKIIFATETFSIGVNFPAKSVVFLGLTKRDSDGLRILNNSEFLQISGRAGRRNLDKRGRVIVCPDYTTEKNIKTVVNNLLKNKCNLGSKFKITNNMILNIVRLNRRVEDFLRLSFGEYFTQKTIGASLKKYEQLNRYIKKLQDNHKIKLKENNEVLTRPSDSIILDLNNKAVKGDSVNKGIESKNFDMISKNQSDEYNSCSEKLTRNISSVDSCDICIDAKIYCQILVKISQLYQILFQNSLKSKTNLKNLEILTKTGDLYSDLIFKNHKLSGTKIKKGNSLYDFFFQNNQLPFQITSTGPPIITLTRNITSESKNLSSENLDINAIFAIYNSKEIYTDFEVSSYEIKQDIYMLKKFIQKALQYNEIGYVDFLEHYEQVVRIDTLLKLKKNLENTIGDEGISTYQDYMKNLKLLLKYRFIGQENQVLIKGQIACEIKTLDCVLMTELLISNCFRSISIENIICICSTLLTYEKHELQDITPLRDEIEEFWNKNLCIIYEETKIKLDAPIVVDSFVYYFGSKYIDPIHDWCTGRDLGYITSKYNLEPGSFLRIISLMNEVCRELISATNIISDKELEEKLVVGIDILKNNTNHFSSLYYDLINT